MSVFLCMDCKKTMELKNGFYSLYYKCPQCSNRFTIRDAEVMDAMQEQGIFQLGRVSGIVIYDNNKKLIYARRKRKNENDL